MTAVLARSAGATDTSSRRLRVPKPTVLIVDDDASKRSALKAILLPLGHEVVEAESGIEALRCLLERDFAVILLDVRMPEMDGFETAALIRKRRQSETTPIIFITAYDRDQLSEAAGYAGGAVDFIFAPVRPNDLRAKVDAFASLWTRAATLAAEGFEARAVADGLRMLMDAAPIGIFETDDENRYVYTNPGWSEITGVCAEDALGREWHSIISAHDREALVVDAPDRDSFSDRFRIVRPDLAVRTVVVTWRLIPDAHSDRSGSVGTIADVTAQAEAEAAMARARDAALAAIVMQKNFTASASHELRTPTTAILGFCEEIMDNDTMTGEDRELLEIVHRNAMRLTRLIEDLLIVGQDEIDATMMRLEPTDVVDLVDRVIDNATAVAQQNDVALVSRSEADVVHAMADPLRLEQALTNLVSNALKFTPKDGRVTIAIASNGLDVDIHVTDTGTGVDPADTDRIFDRFYRAQAAVDGSVHGSGLGLAIAKGMIEAQNGSIGLVSELGHGSTFTISLPAARDESGPLAGADGPVDGASGASFAVLEQVVAVSSLPAAEGPGSDG